MTPATLAKTLVDGSMSTVWFLQQFQAESLPGPVVFLVGCVAVLSAAKIFLRFGLPIICRTLQSLIDHYIRLLKAIRSALDTLIELPARIDELRKRVLSEISLRIELFAKWLQPKD